MSEYDRPPFEQQNTPEIPEWLNPVVGRVAATMAEFAAQNELSLNDKVTYSERLKSETRTRTLISDGIVIAIAHEIEGDGYGMSGFGFSATEGSTTHDLVYFEVKDKLVYAHVTEDIETLLVADLSKDDLRAIEAANNGTDGLLAAWMIHPEAYGVELVDIDNMLLSKEASEKYFNFFASLLTSR